MLDEIKQTYIETAKGLGDYQAISKTDLANGYCDADEAGDELKRSQYYAALMLRYWYKIFKWNESSRSSKLNLEDFTSWLAEGLEWAFQDHQKRVWRDPKGKLYGDPNGPDKAINQCLFSIRNYYYQYYNKDKRKINYICDSIDRQIEIFGDNAEAARVAESDYRDPCRDIVQSFIHKHDVLTALIVDNIAYQDSFLEERKNVKFDFVNEEGETETSSYTNCKYDFSDRKLLSNLRHINERYISYFLSHYDQIDRENLVKIASKLKGMESTSLSSLVKKVKLGLQTNKTVMNILKR